MHLAVLSVDGGNTPYVPTLAFQDTSKGFPLFVKGRQAVRLQGRKLLSGMRIKYLCYSLLCNNAQHSQEERLTKV